MNADQPGFVAKRWGVELQECEKVSGGFSGARVWKVQCREGLQYAIRLTDCTEVAEIDRRNELCEWMAAAFAGGLTCVPAPLKPIAGGLIGACGSFQCRGYLLQDAAGLWQMEPWMPGESLRGSPTATQLSEALGVLSRIHLSGRVLAVSSSSPVSLRVHVAASPGINRRLKIVLELLSGFLDRLQAMAIADSDRRFGRAAKRACDVLCSSLQRLHAMLVAESDVSVPLQPLLRDIWRPHVLYSGDRVTGVIDWNAAATDHVSMDATRLLRSWYRTDHECLRLAYYQFCDDRRMTHHERSLLRALDAANVLLSPVTWMRRRYTGVLAGSVDESVCSRFEELVTTAESFFASRSF